ncbi:relaxase/mobilization nuclease domain-containing protein [Chamaesiphon polymorphus]|uniref:Relaxase/mobilization nuclease n=1 Tax=Chamaesiphon polymorphus CCALA 037 TaxID=2107692 RepID=A0A2T1G7W4_9CYAN|nr:relaxase/mobilization nuclease domain-containing protein [Chamaesiphon polymorphus]PSB53280.1 relaxase/mobilization nuclease [Chamaesiphon polymorphus CCALA 037]
MTIGKISRGGGFRGVLDYVLDPKKKPRIISKCSAGSTPAELAREFRQISNLRPNVKKPVRHFSISFAPEDGAVDDLVKEAIALRVLDGLGYRECQFITIAHDRHDPGHDLTHDHDHIHIVTNAVTIGGAHVRDSFDRYRIQPILREIEAEFGLHQISSSWQVKWEKARAKHLDSDIAKLIDSTLNSSLDLKTWLARLEESDINVRFHLSKDDNVKGITYLKDGEIYKGSDVGASWNVISKRLNAAVGDLDLMKAANLMSQTKPARLSKSQRSMFDRVVEMARLKLGHKSKFKNSRVEIELEGDSLRVLRMRPHKLMFRATQTASGWEPVGFVNVDRRDVELLERMNGAEELPAIPIQRSREASEVRESTNSLAI